MSYLYRADGTQIDVGGGGEYSGIVDFDKLAFGTAYQQNSKPFLIKALTRCWYGKIIEVSAGDTVYFNWTPDNLSELWGHKTFEVYDNFPAESELDYQSSLITGAHRLLGTVEYDTTNNSFTVPLNLTGAKALFVAKAFSSDYERISGIEDYGMGIESGRTLSKWDFDTLNAYYALAQKENFFFSENQNLAIYGSFLKGINRLAGANVLVLGDSNTMRSSYDGADIINSPYTTFHDNNNRCGSGKMYGGYGWMTRIARKYGMTFTTRGRSGCRWWTETDKHSCVLDVQEICADDTLAHDTYDYIVLEYGTNDIAFDAGKFGQYSDVASSTSKNSVAAIRYCIESLQARFDTAAIIVLLPCIFEGEKVNATDVANQEIFITLAKQVLADYGVKWADPKHYAGLTAEMICGDGLHYDYHVYYDPDKTSKTGECNNEGVARVSRCLEAAMLEA